ncbi:MAG TPA: hypothetical protein DCZ95_03760 [Verrucomicrobia bacterium]|nr:hypothetical protein [Verrucomicrobiota bacterium]
MKSIRYRSGYKYQLAGEYSTTISIKSAADIVTPYVSLMRSGLLIISEGYAWDGPSGPTIDTKSSLRGSLVHDALYQLIRLGLLPLDMRCACDDEAHKIWIEDGMLKPRADAWRWCLNRFAGFAAEEKDSVLVAP